MKKRTGSFGGLAALALASMLWAPSAHAIDGCKVLLCMAGNWRAIGECRPVVREAIRDVARGRAWPRCAMAGASNSSGGFFPAENCPLQYRTVTLGWDDRPVYVCPFNGMTEVVVEGQVWSRVYWSTGGEESVTEWLAPAKAAMARNGGTLDDRFERDYAAWRATEDARIEAERLAAEQSN